MKLNLGCGRNKKDGFLNIDTDNRFVPLNRVCNLARELPFPDNSCEYIYAEQFIEHLNWLDGKNFLKRCYSALKEKGTLRLVLPDYKKIFKAYVNEDHDFFESFKKAINENDYPYYLNVYMDPERVLKERPNNPPPKWHTSPRMVDRETLKLRVRHFEHDIEIVHWFTHQFGEHLTLYDFESLCDILLKIGFTWVKKSERIKGFDSDNEGRVKSSLYVEAIK